MDFLKKNYEKVLLGVVLLGLAVAAAFLPFKIASEKQKLEDMRNQLIHPNVKPLTNQDLTVPDSVLKRMAMPTTIDFSSPNRLFNPMAWQKAMDGRLIKVDSTNVGPYAVTVTKMTPLYLKLTLDSVTPMDTGVFAAPADTIWMLPVYSPALKPAGAMDTEGVDGAVPEAGDTLIHPALAVALQESVPVPVPLLAIWMGCAAGTVPPAV